MVENLATLVKTDRFRIYNVDDITEEAIMQFEDYGYFITERGSITYHNITAGFHDDAAHQLQVAGSADGREGEPRAGVGEASS